MPAWKKGQSGNPKGRPPMGETIADAYRAVLAERVTDPENARKKITNRELLARANFRRAVNGHPTALRLIHEYVDGRPVQILDLGGEVVVVKGYGNVSPDDLGDDDTGTDGKIVRFPNGGKDGKGSSQDR